MQFAEWAFSFVGLLKIEWVISAFPPLFSKVLSFFTPLWPPAHRTTGPKGKEGGGERFSEKYVYSIMDLLVLGECWDLTLLPLSGETEVNYQV